MPGNIDWHFHYLKRLRTLYVFSSQVMSMNITRHFNYHICLRVLLGISIFIYVYILLCISIIIHLYQYHLVILLSFMSTIITWHFHFHICIYITLHFHYHTFVPISLGDSIIIYVYHYYLAFPFSSISLNIIRHFDYHIWFRILFGISIRTKSKILLIHYPDSKVDGANMGLIWVLSAPDGPHVGPIKLVIWVAVQVPVPSMNGMWTRPSLWLQIS